MEKKILHFMFKEEFRKTAIKHGCCASAYIVESSLTEMETDYSDAFCL